MRVHITEVQIGDRLISNVFNNYGLHVLNKETVLSPDDIDKLHRHHIDYIDIAMRENFDIIVEVRSSHHEMIIQELQPKFESAINGAKELFEQAVNEGFIDKRTIEQNFNPLIQHFNKERDVVTLLLTMTTNDDYTYQHCVQVGMISYYIARWLGLNDKKASLVGKAGYLHDIGKSKVDVAILNKPDKLTDEEFTEMKNHTIYGHRIISSSLPGNIEIGLAALQHHERMNGKGYPNGILGEQIHPFAKIVAVADVYSAMISSRVYKKKKDLLFVLKELHRLSFSELDPGIVHTFIQKMIPNFIGKKLLLTNGGIGDILMTNPSDPFRPLIRVGDDYIDLNKNHNLEIEKIYL